MKSELSQFSRLWGDHRSAFDRTVQSLSRRPQQAWRLRVRSPYSEFLQDLSGGPRQDGDDRRRPHHGPTYIDKRQRLPRTYSPGRTRRWVAGGLRKRAWTIKRPRPRERRLQLDLRLFDLVAADGADPRASGSSSCGRCNPARAAPWGFGKSKAKPAHRGAWPRHLPGCGRRSTKPRKISKEIVEFPARSPEVSSGWAAKDFRAGVAAGRDLPGNRQDLAGARHRRRSERAVLSTILRLGLRRNVRGRRRISRPRTCSTRPKKNAPGASSFIDEIDRRRAAIRGARPRRRQ